MSKDKSNHNHLYLDSYERFAGTGEKNAAGQTLQEFLEGYDAKAYDCPSNTVDIAVFRKIPGAGSDCEAGSNRLQLLMIRRGNHPNIGYWALPGGFVDLRENLEDAAARELMEETGVTGVTLKQHGTWGDYDRDPRWRVITTLYFTILDYDVPVKGMDDAAEARWFDVVYEEDLPLVHLELRSGEGDGDGGLNDNVICLKADGLCRQQGSGPLAQCKMSPIHSERIAGDHDLMIMDVLHFLKNKGVF